MSGRRLLRFARPDSRGRLSLHQHKQLLYSLDTAAFGIAEALAYYFGVVGYGDFWILQIRVPDFFPFETIETFVADSLQGFDLALYGNCASAGQDVFAIFASAY